jgi:hypothetical protein
MLFEHVLNFSDIKVTSAGPRWVVKFHQMIANNHQIFPIWFHGNQKCQNQEVMIGGMIRRSRVSPA